MCSGLVIHAFECMQPATYRISTRSVKPRSFHRALILTKRLSTWQSVTPPISSADNQDTAFAADKLCPDKLFALTSEGRCSIHRSRRNKTFSSRKLHRSDMSKKFVSPRFCKQLFVLWEPRELGKCRDKSMFGDGCDTCNGNQAILASPSEGSSEKVNQSLDFPHFVCILCKWGARQAAELRQERRRSTQDIY